MDIKAWLEATRPKTLPASIVPVLVGSSLAFNEGNFRLDLLIVTLICSIFIQLITNFINEVYDFIKGADNHTRIGPKRQVASGTISSQTMLTVSFIISIITFVLGLYLVFNSDIIILIVGIISIVFAFLYTGGPYPLAYKGLGDIFVFIFFGLIAVNGSYYVQTLEISKVSILLSLPPGLLSANILNVNNIRDIDTDHLAGKITLAYRIGKKNAILLYYISTIISYIVPFIIYYLTDNIYTLLPLLSLPLAINLLINIKNKSGKELNSVLAKTGALLFLYGVLNAAAFILK
ncbi:MAG TPA: 1,4-dihydroxy-2-naphthoate polyprenyltransferase [Candidatus Kapabacteria bacterium]|nr:1,4-dihydroxy-2-naphthoate polyprenyltransferase [Candidatus Kapabacteria bacterium]